MANYQWIANALKRQVHKENQSWKHGSINQVLVLRAWEPKFNPHYPTKCQGMMASASALRTVVTGTDSSMGLTDKQEYSPCHGQGQWETQSQNKMESSWEITPKVVICHQHTQAHMCKHGKIHASPIFPINTQANKLLLSCKLPWWNQLCDLIQKTGESTGLLQKDKCTSKGKERAKFRLWSSSYLAFLVLSNFVCSWHDGNIG